MPMNERRFMPTILYAEDDSQVADFVRVLFERDLPEATLEFVGNGFDCLARLAAQSFDLVLLDLVLPGRDGLAVLSELAQRGNATPVIVISSHGQYEQTVSVLRAGAIDCIDKKSGRFLETARIVRRFLAQTAAAPAGASAPADAAGGRRKTVILLERDEQTALTTAAILARECPSLVVRTVASRFEWDRFYGSELPCAAVVVNDDWDFEDLTKMLRDVRSADRRRPAILLSRRGKPEVIVAAYALGCRDCIVQRHGYHSELARSLNHLLREQAEVPVVSA